MPVLLTAFLCAVACAFALTSATLFDRAGPAPKWSRFVAPVAWLVASVATLAIAAHHVR